MKNYADGSGCYPLGRQPLRSDNSYSCPVTWKIFQIHLKLSHNYYIKSGSRSVSTRRGNSEKWFSFPITDSLQHSSFTSAFRISIFYPTFSFSSGWNGMEWRENLIQYRMDFQALIYSKITIAIWRNLTGFAIYRP